ncbi:MAG: YIP1 family protein [Ignavibacteriales bacterium]|nr:YIP1 family protein [Ignavibacteriales bacterium]
MTLSDRIRLLLSSPDDATLDVYETPHIGHAFFIVTIFAFVSSFNSFLSAGIKSESFGFSLIAFLGTFFVTYVTWVFLTIVFHLAAEVWGGLGELPNALAFVGFAAAPMIITSVVSVFVTVGGGVVLPEDPEKILPKISLIMTLIGMGWGWPGLLCYYGLKNGERLHVAKAATISLVAYISIAVYELNTSSAFD